MIMEQIYHLYITHKCGHNCPLCCNRLYDIDKLPVITVEDLKNGVQRYTPTSHSLRLRGTGEIGGAN